MRSVQRLAGIYREAFSGLSRDLWILGIAALVNRSGTMVLPFLSLYLTAERGMSISAAGRLVGIYGAGAVCGAYLGGGLSDRIGAVRAQQLSLVAGGLGLLVIGAVRRPTLIGIALFVVAMLVEAFRPAVMAAFAEHAPGDLKPKAFAFLRLAVNLGVGIGAAVGGALAVYGYRWLFVGDAVTCLAGALLLQKVSASRRAVGGEHETTTPASPFRDLPFLCLLVLVVVMASVLFQIFSTLPLYLREHVGLRENAIGMLISLNAILIVAFEMVLIHLVARRDRMSVVGVGAALLCAGYALMPYHDATWYLAVTVGVWTFGEMLSLPILNVIVAERAGVSVQGRYMGLYATAYALAFIVAPIAGTFVYDRFGPLALWHTIGVVGIGLWLGTVVLRPYLR
jgi:predicted MFS family arabinose efflux permease